MQLIKFSKICAFFAVIFMTGCLHITEDVSLNEDNSGTYSMKLDMGEVKGMMSSLQPSPSKETKPESTPKTGTALEGFGDLDASNMIKEFSATTVSLQKIKGLSNIKPIHDTTAYMFGYTFDFQDIEALNQALNLVNKEKFNSSEEQIFKSTSTGLVRSASADYGDHIRKSITESEKDMDQQTMSLMKMFFQTMSYEQVYHFKGKVKQTSNSLSKISDDGHTVRIKSLPFSENYTKPTTATHFDIK